MNTSEPMKRAMRAERWLALGGVFWILGGGFFLALPADVLAQKITSRFVHQAPASAPAGKTLRLQGKITFTEDLDYAEFRYRKISGGSEYKTIRMKQRGDSFYVDIPASVMQPPGIEYYATGTDFNQKLRFLAGSLALPLQILVVPGAEDPDARPDPRPRDGIDDPDGRVGDPKAPLGKAGPGETLSRDLTVTTTDKRLQTQTTAPGTATVITSSDIQTYGWRTLVDILRNVAGIDVNDPGSWADIGMRGINTPGTRGRRLLFLIDGHDMSWRQLQQNLVGASWLSVDDIERIEIIRGPMTGLWGANAALGVVHIITKTGAKMNGIGATLGVSPVTGTHFVTVRGGKAFASGLSFYSSFSMHHAVRSPHLPPLLEFQDSKEALLYISPNDRALGQSFFSKVSWQGLTLSLHQGRFDAVAPMNPYTILGGEDTRFVTDRVVARLSWDAKLGGWGIFHLWASYDRMQLSGGSQVAFNPFSSQTTPAKQQGRSQAVIALQKIGGADVFVSFPLCENLQEDAVRCVRRQRVEYTDPNAQPVSEDACVIFVDRKVDPSTQRQVTIDQKYTLWVPKAECRDSFTQGRYTAGMTAVDNRINAGLALSAKPAKGLHLYGAFEFEYLLATLWHFPELWIPASAEQKAPDLANYRLGLTLQGQYALNELFEITAAFRLDADERWGTSFRPQAAFVIRPGAGTFAKLHYAWGFRPPSLYELTSYEKDQFGNPGLVGEENHTVGLQVGWMRPGLLLVSLSGYFASFSNPIENESRVPTAQGVLPPLEGADQFPRAALPSAAYRQFVNHKGGYTSFGGELELRIFPIRGFEMIGHFGLSLANRSFTAPNGEEIVERLLYTSALQAGLSASYRFKAVQNSEIVLSLGFLFVGSKLVNPSAWQTTGTIPVSYLREKETAQAMPRWDAKNDPRGQDAQASGYAHLHLTLQWINLFDHLDIALRLQNLLGAFSPAYDASDPFLLPQQGFEVLTWLRLHY